ncbi:hypothetical protein ACU8KH_01770 [Lachancea thermotolerans]
MASCQPKVDNTLTAARARQVSMWSLETWTPWRIACCCMNQRQRQRRLVIIVLLHYSERRRLLDGGPQAHGVKPGGKNGIIGEAARASQRWPPQAQARLLQKKNNAFSTTLASSIPGGHIQGPFLATGMAFRVCHILSKNVGQFG